jgi:hypothetical protein
MNITHGSILAVFFSASGAEIAEGEYWYARASMVCRGIAEQYKLPLETVAGVLAALSPNNRWSRNIIDTEAIVKAYVLSGQDVNAVKVSTFGKNKAKAIAILQGAAPLDVLGGLKVRAFYGCVIGGNEVCVDGHAYSIWLGQRVPTSKTPKISAKLYQQIADDYNLAATQINTITGRCYTGAQIQAITWVTWRNLHKGELK